MPQTRIDKAMTVQRFTSGSGTYTLPTNPSPSFLIVKMVGGGGGGEGGGTGGGGTGGTGGTTSFGSSLLTATGGAGGTFTAAAQLNGGTANLNSPAVAIVLATGAGITGGSRSGISDSEKGTDGADSVLGGRGGGGSSGDINTATGGTAAGNSGSGGGGGGSSITGTANYPGLGGAAGGYIEAMLSTPSSSYSFSVGVGGTAGSPGTSGGAGGTGGSGVIVVEEYY